MCVPECLATRGTSFTWAALGSAFSDLLISTQNSSVIMADGDAFAAAVRASTTWPGGRHRRRRLRPHFQGDDFGFKNVGHDLPPDFGFCSAAGGADLARAAAEFSAVGADRNSCAPGSRLPWRRGQSFPAVKVFGGRPGKLRCPPGHWGCARLQGREAGWKPAREPTGALAASAANWSWDILKSLRTISVATVTFMVQSRGSQRLVESQKAAQFRHGHRRPVFRSRRKWCRWCRRSWR